MASLADQPAPVRRGITNQEDYTMKKIIAAIVIALSLSACGTLREFNKPEVGAEGSREFRATAAIGRCRC
ncbi:hypothetical protein CUB19_gp29c [Stenotrophomonas phage CUB19]|nr:hypothetical protein CUB19_gp29c [Stenotrophomonas phage CUB19]